MRKVSLALFVVLAAFACLGAAASAGTKPAGAKAGNGFDAQGYPECTPYLSENIATLCAFTPFHAGVAHVA